MDNENIQHYCQDNGAGICMICGKPMPEPKEEPKEERDHYFQDRGDGKCLVCNQSHD